MRERQAEKIPSGGLVLIKPILADFTAKPEISIN